MSTRSVSLDPIGKSRMLRRVLTGLFLLMIAFAAIRLCSYRSLTIDVLGSYFPAWMLCLISGLMLTLVSHWIIQARHLKDYVGPGPVIHPCLMLIFTFLTWILFYQN